MSAYRLPASTDTIDVADVARTVRRQWRAVLVCCALGVVAATAVILFAPRKFDAKVTLLARPGSPNNSSISARLGGLGELLGGGGGGLGALAAGSMETELQMLRSRALAGELVDSLLLQVKVRDPSGRPPNALFAAAVLPGVFAPRKFTIEKQPDGRYLASGHGRIFTLRPGFADSIGIGTVTLSATGLPDRFKVTIRDREDAVDRTTKALTITKAGGDIARIVYRGDDSLTAPAAANALVKFYLDRRKTTDRGVNQKRVEFVSVQLDSTRAELTRTERALREYQESSRVLDAAVVGEVELEAAATLRGTLTELQVDEGAIKQLLGQADAGRLTSRDLAAYPAFLRGSSVSPLATQLSELEAQRIRLLERRTERDPEVHAVDATIRAVQANIVAMARSYAAAVTRQREQMQSRLDSIQTALLALPAAAERGGRLQRDVLRLSQISTALEAQLVEARLAAIGEGGEIRQIDVAVPQRKPSFPRAALTMGVGTAGGLLAGMIAALFLGWFGRWLRDPVDIERAVGVSAERFEPNAPLLLAGTASARSVLVVPLDSRASDRAGSVAERLARTAQQRALPATVLDLSAHDVGRPMELAAPGTLIEQVEQANGMTVVRLPALGSDVTLSAMRENRPVVLVAAPGPVNRAQLGHAVDALRRLQVPCAGVVISDGPGSRALI